MVAESFLAGSAERPSSSVTFCDAGINVWLFATTPAAFAYQVWVPHTEGSTTGVFVESHYCTYPPSLTSLVGDCDTAHIEPPSQRFCPCWLGNCDVPTAMPTTTTTESPTVAVTEAPTIGLNTTNCNEWILGFGRESCTLTCSRIGRTCSMDHLEQIITLQAFNDMVEQSTYLGTCDIDTSAQYCNKGINVYNFAQSPASFTYRLHTLSGGEDQTYCNYPTSLSALSGDCDTKYIYPPASRFCPCVMDSPECAPAPTALPTASVAPTTAMPTSSVAPTQLDAFQWVLGYSTESCTQSCDRVSGTCVHSRLSDVTTLTAFNSMMDTVVFLDPSVTSGDASTFCSSGINSLNFANTPSAFTYVTQNFNGSTVETYCSFPTSAAALGGDCDTAHAYPPAQRFCVCEIPHPDPTTAPSNAPVTFISHAPAADPTGAPISNPTGAPVADPSTAPIADPSAAPVADPTSAPNADPSASPNHDPSVAPIPNPTTAPVADPSSAPIADPSSVPIADPSSAPISDPTGAPIADPSFQPSTAPAADPTNAPVINPSTAPIADPSTAPIADPSTAPISDPTGSPIADPSYAPTTSPTAPTVVPTFAPTGCYQWVVGYSSNSCDQTCGDPEIGGTCQQDLVETITTDTAFDEMLCSAYILGSITSGEEQPTGRAGFCGGGVNVWTFATAPAAFAYQSYFEDPNDPNGGGYYVVDHYCYFPTAPATVTGSCATQYPGPPSQRFCACAIPDCSNWNGTMLMSY